MPHSRENTVIIIWMCLGVYAPVYTLTEIVRKVRSSYLCFFIKSLYRKINTRNRNILIIYTYPSRYPLQSVYLNKLLKALLFSFLWGNCSGTNLLPLTIVLWSETGLNQTLATQNYFLISSIICQLCSLHQLSSKFTV